MNRRALSLVDSGTRRRAVLSDSDPAAISTKKLEQYANAWLLDCEIRLLSARTLANRKGIAERFLWFLHESEIEVCDRQAVRLFLRYVGQPCATGRWGLVHEKSANKEGTVATYHRAIHVMFDWIIQEGGLQASPMENVAAPPDRRDDIIPFTPEQVEALLEAAQKSSHPERNFALMMFLLDTGARISEACTLTLDKVDLVAGTAIVIGKGNKERKLQFGRICRRAIYGYLRHDAHEEDDPLFKAYKGRRNNEFLTASGALQIVRKLGAAAGITDVRVSPHTCRHTFAIEFLRSGGNQFTLMKILGHTNVQMTSRYVEIAQADIAAQHRLYSPMDRHKTNKSKLRER